MLWMELIKMLQVTGGQMAGTVARILRPAWNSGVHPAARVEQWCASCGPCATHFLVARCYKICGSLS
jgi:hypothetical protein